MWILTEEQNCIIEPFSRERFFISENDEKFNVLYDSPDIANYIALGAYSNEVLAITAIRNLFEALRDGERGHAMF